MAKVSPLIKTDGVIEGAEHCLRSMPYRAVVFHSINQHKIPLYLVAGSNKPASKAESALRDALSIHGGMCHYCAEKNANLLTLDHVEPSAAGKVIGIQNFVLACKPCNASKGKKQIEAFNPDAGKAWLQALLIQVQERLNRLP